LIFSIWPAASAQPVGEGPFPVFYGQAEIFQEAIARAEPFRRPGRVTGLIVPHHLLASDLIARAMASATGGGYRRIIILGPDHYRRGRGPFSVPGRDFLSPLGRATLDRAGAERLLSNPLVSTSNLFSHEHAFQTLLPFLVHYFPEARVLPVALSATSSQNDWDSLFETLRPLLDEETLLIQSTDFSHYLKRAAADLKDAESAEVIMSEDYRAAAGLNQPAHLDSRAALYLQMKAQKELGARPRIEQMRNSVHYGAAGEPEADETTSYLLVVYRRPPEIARPDLLPDKQAAPGQTRR